MMSKKNVLLGVGISVVSAGVGSAVTWFVAKKILDEQYDERVRQEVESSVKYILKKIEHDKPLVVSDEDPDELAEKMSNEEQPLTVQLGYIEADIEQQEEELDKIEGERVFGSQDEKPPLEDLVARNQTTNYNKISTPEEPEEIFPEQPPIESVEKDPDISIISQEVFLANENGWEQESLQYFSDDGVLNISGDFVEDHEKLIGPGKPPFGELSQDDRVVYLRNQRIEKEFEIVYDEGKASDFLAHSLGEMYKPDYLR